MTYFWFFAPSEMCQTHKHQLLEVKITAVLNVGVNMLIKTDTWERCFILLY